MEYTERRNEECSSCAGETGVVGKTFDGIHSPNNCSTGLAEICIEIVQAMVPCLEQLYAGFRLKLCQIKMPSKTDISHPNAA